MIWVGMIVACVVGSPRVSSAHALDNASLTLVERTPQRFVVKFQAGSSALLRDVAQRPAEFPEQCRFDGAHLDCGTRGLVGELGLPWLEGSSTRLLLDVQCLDGTRVIRMLSSSSPSVRIYGRAATRLETFLPVVGDYVVLGIEHILAGWDHLCFVVALALLVSGRRQLLGTITAFTLAHSVTLACSALGFWAVPVAPVEALIALSIVLLCVECLKVERTLTRRAPWLAAFCFGLLHGFGFASALSDVGLPQAHLSLALFCFNVGVELGQLMVIVVCVLLGRAVLRLRIERWARPALIYAMGGVAAAWSLERAWAILLASPR